jgi:hypothetical protein
VPDGYKMVTLVAKDDKKEKIEKTNINDKQIKGIRTGQIGCVYIARGVWRRCSSAKKLLFDLFSFIIASLSSFYVPPQSTHLPSHDFHLVRILFLSCTEKFE